MRLHDARRVLQRLSYRPGTRAFFKLERYKRGGGRDDIVLWTSLTCPNSVTKWRGSTARVRGGLPMRPAQFERMNTAAFLDVVALAVASGETHESYEWLTYRGRHVTDPHPGGGNGPPWPGYRDIERILRRHHL